MLTDADMHALGFIAKLRGRSAARMVQQNHTDNEREYRAMSKETSAGTRAIRFGESLAAKVQSGRMTEHYANVAIEAYGASTSESLAIMSGRALRDVLDGLTRNVSGMR